ncbi:hypothetical protein I312_100427 [Cryptococcus bacillisporus CA1280]|uniref:POT family proton-dependent oligopeptide transporter n=2 Tax=Cryptococcus gattii TaxID=552467 RepID=A0A0D0VTV2_CRYGA|nr:POT family proton-dependent oligopeptide transporter [Cryptococcus bacillisporus CA1280]KIR68488.1 POT family proton-dependent oligopeptide transporter [Cryptococcus bacillisporus CA1873]|eukprot:KIR68488.1 POT family proton-dependent oligopeptide transporter [Cryptococcus gattii CA1873]
MTTHANAIQDFEAAPVPSAAIPSSENKTSAAGAVTLGYGDKKDSLPDVLVGDAGAIDYIEEVEPTDEEYAVLKKVHGKMPWVCIAMCAIELAERASYYGITGVVQNFIKNPLPEGGNGAGAVAPGAAGANQSAGALGRGSVQSSACYNAFVFLAYVFPIMGGILADTRWGRFKTVAIGTAVGAFAHILMVVVTIPQVLKTGNGLGPFLLSFYILSFAAGFIKPCLATLLCDQSPVKKPVITTSKTGERVILDPQTTVQRYLLIFYWCINVGGFFAIASSYSARFVGFWLAYLLPGIVYMLMPIVLVMCYKRLYKAPPQGSVTLEAMKVLYLIFKKGGFIKMFKGGDEFWQEAKPSYILAKEGSVDTSKVFWDDLFVDEIRQSIAACGVFALIPIFNLADGGIGSQENDMSTAMTLNNAPNDVISNFNPLTIIVATPIITYGLYPFFDKIGYPLRPMTRMAIGFILGMANMIYGAVLQWRIYSISECGWYASTCDTVTSVSIWAQIPLYSLPAIGEIFVNVTSYELAYTRAPARMKGLVYALCLFNQAISSAIGLACSNAIQDPYLIWPYVALAVACLLCAVLCPTYFRHLNDPVRTFADPARQAGKLQELEPLTAARESQSELNEKADEKA